MSMKLAAGEYKLVIKENGKQCVFDANGKEIYYKTADGFEVWYEYNANGQITHFKNSNGHEVWQEYNAYGNCIHWKNSNGHEEWYDANGYIISKAEYDALQAPYHNTLVEIEGKKYKLSAI